VDSEAAWQELAKPTRIVMRRRRDNEKDDKYAEG
jgi:hypothetical protein